MAIDIPNRRRIVQRVLCAACAGWLLLLVSGTTGCGEEKAEQAGQAARRPPPGADSSAQPSAQDTGARSAEGPEPVTLAGEQGRTDSVIAAIGDDGQGVAAVVPGTTAGSRGPDPAQSRRTTEPPRNLPAGGARTSSAIAARGPYVLQVGSFQRRERAAERVAALKAAGVEADIVEAFVDGLLYHRVFVPGLGSLDEATWLGERLAAEHGFSYLVRKQP